MDSLIARLEAATEGSRELSNECLLAVGWEYRHDILLPPDWLDKDKNPSGNIFINSPWPPDPSQNVQDAITWMVPEGWDWAVSTMVRDHLDKPLCHAEIAKAHTGVCKARDIHEIEAAAPALALSAASLKAIEALVAPTTLQAKGKEGSIRT